MGWNLQDQDVLNTITSGLAPPGDIESLLADDSWANIFSMWATDMGYGGGDYTASTLFALWRDYRYGTDWQTVKATYVDAGGPSAMAWPDSVIQRFDRVVNGMEDDATGAMQELWAAAIEKFDPYVQAFLADINDLQSATPSEPTTVELTLADINRDVVDSINRETLKSIDAASGVDSFVQYWQLGDLVLLGDSHPAQYVAYVQSHGGGSGQIYMSSKGGFASRGELLVQGHGSYYEHSDDFKAAIRRFSQKKLKMV